MALVMYDLDGTLVDTVEEIADAANMTLRQYQHSVVPMVQIQNLIGLGTGWLMKQVWPEKKDTESPEVWEEIMASFTIHYSAVVGSKSKPFPQVIETLKAVKALGIKQAVITNKEQPFTDRVLEKSGLNDIFDLVISGNTLSVKKPDAAVIHYCLDRLSERAETSLFVGDSAIDVKTAKNAKVTCWAVPYGYNGGKNILLSNPDRMIKNIGTVPEYFDQKFLLT